MLNRKNKILIGITTLILVVLIAIPLFAKYYINNNGKELIGRKVNLESLSLNYFTGGLGLGELLIYEENEKDTFLFVNELNVNPNITQIIAQKYVIQNIAVDGLKCNTILTDTVFNFNSIISHFNDTSSLKEEETPAIYFSLEKVALTNSYISYHDKNLNSFIAINQFNTSLPKGFASDDTDIDVLSNFNFTHGGAVDSKINYHLDKGEYKLNLNSKEINLEILLPYLKDFMAVNELKGSLSTNLFLHGNAQESANIDIQGVFGVNNIALIDTFNVKTLALRSMEIDVDSVNPAKDQYQLSAVKLDLPYARYEMFPETDNFSQLFMLKDSTETEASNTENESNVFVMIKDYVVETLHGIKASNFSIDTVEITNVEALYIDHTMLQKFKYNVSKGDLRAYNVKSNADSLIVNFNALLNKKGKLKAEGVLHPQKPEDVNILTTIEGLEMRDLSPYFHQHLAYPITKGVFKMNTSVIVIDKQLNSTNNLFLQSFKLGKKQKHDEASNLPVKMGVAMLKNRKGHIELDVPVKGDLADPEYKVWKTIGKIFSEILLKAATSPYTLIAGAVDTDEESTKRININNLTAPLTDRHHIKLDNLVKVLSEKPELILLIDPYYNINNEVEKIAEFKAIKEFKTLNKTSSVNIKDSVFIAFVNSKTMQENLSLDVSEKIKKMYSFNELKGNVEEQIKQKTLYINNYLIEKGVLPKQINKAALDGAPFDQSANNNVKYHLQFDVYENAAE